MEKSPSWGTFLRLFQKILQPLVVGGLYLLLQGQGSVLGAQPVQQKPGKGRVVNQQRPQQIGAKAVAVANAFEGTLLV